MRRLRRAEHEPAHHVLAGIEELETMVRMPESPTGLIRIAA